MEQSYNIETLASTFTDHAKLADEHHKFVIDEYKKNFPDSEVPTHMVNVFNISKALAVMAAEINTLKNNCV